MLGAAQAQAGSRPSSSVPQSRDGPTEERGDPKKYEQQRVLYRMEQPQKQDDAAAAIQAMMRRSFRKKEEQRAQQEEDKAHRAVPRSADKDLEGRRNRRGYADDQDEVLSTENAKPSHSSCL